MFCKYPKKKEILSRAAGLTSGISMPKLLLAFVYISSVLQGEPSDMPREDISLDEVDYEEVAMLDGNNLTIQQPIGTEKVQLPVPRFELRPPKSSFLAVGLSTLLPGLGHFYLNDMKTASALVGITGVGIGTVSFLHSHEARQVGILTMQNIWSYGLYAAYRDVRAYNGHSSYSYKMPMDSLTDLTSAPFSLSILKKPEVWGGFLAKFVLAFGVAYLALPKEVHGHSSQLLKRSIKPFIALPVGIGEESLFRGYLQSQFSEIFNPWVGLTLSSLAFGAAHIPNALYLPKEERRNYYTFSVPFITLAGAYYGWLTYKNRSLKESVALHTWYDFVLFALGSMAGETALTGHPKFSIAVPF